MEYSEHFQQDVNLNESGVHIPIEIYEGCKYFSMFTYLPKKPFASFVLSLSIRLWYLWFLIFKKFFLSCAFLLKTIVQVVVSRSHPIGQLILKKQSKDRSVDIENHIKPQFLVQSTLRNTKIILFFFNDGNQ
jgi:hypothetical protein